MNGRESDWTQTSFLSFLVCIHTSSFSLLPSKSNNESHRLPFYSTARLVWTLLITIICWTPPLPDEGRIPKQNKTSPSVFIFVVVATFHRILLLLAFICLTEDRLWPLIALVHLIILFRGNCASRNQLSLYLLLLKTTKHSYRSRPLADAMNTPKNAQPAISHLAAVADLLFPLSERSTRQENRTARLPGQSSSPTSP